jgi:hypothetical protein
MMNAELWPFFPEASGLSIAARPYATFSRANIPRCSILNSVEELGVLNYQSNLALAARQRCVPPKMAPTRPPEPRVGVVS